MRTRLIPSAVAASVATVALGLAGCESTGLSPRESAGFDVSAYQQALALDPITAVSPDSPDRPTTPMPVIKPASICVVQIGEVTPPDEFIERLEKETDLFDRVQGISGISPAQAGYHHRSRDRAIAGGQVKQHLNSLIATSRTMGADYLLVYGGTVDSTERAGTLTLFDLTIAGAFIVPSRAIEADAKAAANIIDLRDRRVVAIATATTDSFTLSPTVGKDGRQASLMQRVADNAIEEMADRIVEQFREM
jgi:hypothetical protein